ncbi:MAG TPA: hypothetical protein VJM53_05395, partial [Burkholderiales bacterium]|nr:hypothetical protein [Burkholderiales bacterium]
MHLQLAVPDLLWPDPSLTQAAPETPALLETLAKGRRRRIETRNLDRWLLQAFGVPEAGAAGYALRADGGDPGGASWLCADPCHLRVNRDRVMLADAYSFELSREEAEALVEALNAHFAGDGLTFYPMQPHRWYVRLNEPPIIESTPLAEVRGKDIDPYLPRGPEAMRWRGFLNEAQMLLHQHSVNEAREERGALPINSVWLWGEGPSASPTARPFQRVRGRSALAAGLALASGASAQERPEHASEWFKNTSAEGVELIVLDDLLAPA